MAWVLLVLDTKVQARAQDLPVVSDWQANDTPSNQQAVAPGDPASFGCLH